MQAVVKIYIDKEVASRLKALGIYMERDGVLDIDGIQEYNILEETHQQILLYSKTGFADLTFEEFIRAINDK